jgi:hypothetical protein
MTSNPIFGVAVVTFSWRVLHGLVGQLSSIARNARCELPCESDGGHRPTAAGRPQHPPHQEGTTVAKNKNQNRQRDQHAERGERGDQRPEQQEGTRAPMPDELGMPASTQAPRKQKQRFGHN